jgi:hypothetical protein
VAHVQFALEDTNKCLGAGPVRLALVFADQVIIQDRVSPQTIRLTDLGQGGGAVLVEPGREAKVVSTKVGPSVLQHLLPAAAFGYWGEPACRNPDGPGE